MHEEISEELKQAFRDGNADNILVRLAAWSIIEKAGLAKSYCVGGRFIQLALTQTGIRIRDEVMADAI